ncbi:MAG TPA: hypothetical protein VJ747_17465 [Stellaceae bacterium]|nr:hypothetical protein [Stellaceae bacterium]
MLTRLWNFTIGLHATVGTVAFAALVLLALYILYVAKMHAGIDIFPHWGLHLPGPRTLLRIIAHWLAS